MGLLGTILGIGSAAANLIPVAGPAISAGLGVAASAASGAGNSRAARRAAGIMSGAANRSADDILAESERGSTDIANAGAGAAGDVEFADRISTDLMAQNANLGVGRIDDAARGLDPYVSGGRAALDRILAGIAQGGEFAQQFTGQDFLNEPGLRFRIQQGTQALEGSATARGLFSGDDAKAIQDYGQRQGSDEFDRAYGRFMGYRQSIMDPLQALAASGQNAVGTQINAAGKASDILTGTARDIGDLRLGATTAAGNFRTRAAGEAAGLRADARKGASAYRTDAASAQAGGEIGAANAWTGALNNIAKIGAETDWGEIASGIRKKKTQPVTTSINV